MSGLELDMTLEDKINDVIKKTLSPRFLPNKIIEVQEIPRTLSGKKLEVPVKKLLLGGDAKTVVNRDSMANPHSFNDFISYAQARKIKD
jgi:acetoacetyl-CoA synthetase